MSSYVRETSSQDHVEQKSYIEQQTIAFELNYENELAKGDNANLDLLFSFARSIIVLSSRSSVREDNESSFKNIDRITTIVIQIQKTYDNQWSIVILAFSSSVTIIGGLCGFAPIVGGVLGAQAATMTKIAGIAQPMTTAGQATGNLREIPNNHSTRDRTGFEHYQNATRETENQLRETMRSTKERGRQSEQAERDAIAVLHNIFTTMSSSNSAG